MHPHDTVRIRHIIEALQDCLDFASSRSRIDLDQNRMLQLALARAIEIAGEAASKITEPARKEFSEVPWSKIVGMRNRLVHAYFDVNLDVLWDTATIDAPRLLALLKAIIPAD